MRAKCLEARASIRNLAKFGASWSSLLLMTLLSLLVSTPRGLAAPYVAMEFATGSTSLPAGAVLYGNGMVSNGVLVLTPDVASYNTAVIFGTNSPTPVSDFYAEMDIAFFKTNGVAPADGMCFSFGSNFVNGVSATAAELGVGNSISVCVEVYANNTRGVSLIYNTNIIGAKYPLDLIVLNSTQRTGCERCPR